jgi:hypothetical protein
MTFALQVIDSAFFHVHIDCILVCLSVVVRNLIPFSCHFIASNVQVTFIWVLVLFFYLPLTTDSHHFKSVQGAFSSSFILSRRNFEFLWFFADISLRSG